MLPTTRKTIVGLLLIGMLGVGSASIWSKYTISHFTDAEVRFREESTHAHTLAAQRVEGGLKSIYENLRTLAALPSIRNISRHGENFSAEAKVTFQQVYNNLASNIQVSEVYVVPADFDPERNDPVTWEKESPILMFDEFIVNAGASNPFKPVAAATKLAHENAAMQLPEEEQYEYAQLKASIAWLQQAYPKVNADNILDVPVIAGAQVITCDNSAFVKTRNNEDRTGLMFSVPFFDMDGAFKGTVTAIILNKALRDLLPSADFAIVNPHHGYVNSARPSELLSGSAQYVKSAQQDPALAYSGALQVGISDPRSDWFVWSGRSEAEYLASAPYLSARQFQRAGYFTIGLISLFLAAFWLQSIRNIKRSLKLAAKIAVEQAQEEGAAAHIARATATLQGATSPFMLVDGHGTILTLNPAAEAMFRSAAADLQHSIPGFKADSLTGKSVEIFDRSLNGQAHTAETVHLPIGDRHFVVTVSPLISDSGGRLGLTLEWEDKTSEIMTQKQIASVVRAASQGDFSRRIDLANKHGFLHELSRGVNELTATVDHGLSEAVRVMSALAAGDLKQRFQGEFAGNFLKLKSDANVMADKVSGVILGIAGVSNRVEQSVGKLLSGMTHLQERTEQQAAALEETAATMEEFSASLHQSAANAGQAKDAASRASVTASQGSAIAQTAITAVTRIDDSTKRIDQIVSLIQEIAFQTNILSLNAAVEAARAGDAGRGFAVVATEVRALAQRTSQASKEINDLISRTNVHVKEGVGLAGDTGTSLANISATVQDVSKLVTEIALASREQSSGIHQVASAVSQMDHVTQQNNMLVMETQADLSRVNQQIHALQQAIRFFSVEDVRIATNAHPNRVAG